MNKLALVLNRQPLIYGVGYSLSSHLCRKTKQLTIAFERLAVVPKAAALRLADYMAPSSTVVKISLTCSFFRMYKGVLLFYEPGFGLTIIRIWTVNCSMAGISYVTGFIKLYLW